METENKISKMAWLLIVIAALGYFVDVYDLLVFSSIRSASLTSLGVAASSLLSVGLNLLNWQSAGLIIGGIIWGMLGDKKGRKSVLFGSIALYSVANLLNIFATTIPFYAFCRFLAGLGLAGELGAGITLVSEMVPKTKRGIATMVVAGVGFLGAIAASFVALNFHWQTAFLVGGIGGLLLLMLRAGTLESALYKKAEQSSSASRGNLWMLISNPGRLWKYLLSILVGAQAYLVIGILITGAPEFGKAEGLSPAPVAAIAIIVGYTALVVGDVLCSSFSQVVKSRKWALVLFNAICFAACLFFILYPSPNLTFFYFKTALMGFGVGSWAVMSTNAAEQFGTNLRATTAITVPNFVRGLLIPMTIMFTAFQASYGLRTGAVITSVILGVIAIGASLLQKDAFHKELDYMEM